MRKAAYECVLHDNTLKDLFRYKNSRKNHHYLLNLNISLPNGDATMNLHKRVSNSKGNNWSKVVYS